MRFLICSFLLSFSVFSKQYNWTIQAGSFQEALDAKSRLGFQIKSTKAGLFTSDVEGVAKKFTIKASVDKKSFKATQVSIVIDSSSLDTDSESRDEKMHNLCLSTEKFSQIVVSFSHNHSLMRKREVVDGKITVRGKTFPIKVDLASFFVGDHLKVAGSSNLSFKALNIPDPSIAVAKVHDEIIVKFNFDLKV